MLTAKSNRYSSTWLLRRAGSRAALALVVCLAWSAWNAAPADAGMFIEVEFFEGVDIGAYETWAWRAGNSSANFNVEATIHTTAEEQMAEKGYRMVSGDASCYLVTRVVSDEGFPAGVLKVELVDAASEKVVWRGMATGVIVSSNPKKIASLVRRAVKKMFKQFPKSRAQP